ncbi:MAG: hypothetical protein IJR59_07585 [Firmicutes bacterium]|nr:hypothetical protein [Bacillota bacterium]
MKPNSFVHRFVKVAGSQSESIADTITTTQPNINYEVYQSSYLSFLDVVPQGIISPSSLGTSTKKTDIGKKGCTYRTAHETIFVGIIYRSVLIVLFVLYQNLAIFRQAATSV